MRCRSLEGVRRRETWIIGSLGWGKEAQSPQCEVKLPCGGCPLPLEPKLTLLQGVEQSKGQEVSLAWGRAVDSGCVGKYSSRGQRVAGVQGGYLVDQPSPILC